MVPISPPNPNTLGFGAKNSPANHRCINKVWEEKLLHRRSNRSEPAEVGCFAELAFSKENNPRKSQKLAFFLWNLQRLGLQKSRTRLKNIRSRRRHRRLEHIKVTDIKLCLYAELSCSRGLRRSFLAVPRHHFNRPAHLR